MKSAWQLTPLGEVLTERTEVPSDDDLASGRVRIVEKISFDSGTIHLREHGATNTGMILVRPGDLLVSGINAAKGAIAIYDESASQPVAATIHYGTYAPTPQRVDGRFLWWMLRSGFFRELLLEYVPGGIKTELKSRRLLPIPVPLPPLPEQRRIVARIDDCAGQIADSRGLRKQAADQADALITSYLRVTVEALAQRHGVTELQSLICEAAYGTSARCSLERDEGALPVLRIPNVTSERIATEPLKFTRFSAGDAARFTLAKGDILVVRTNGSLDLVGRCAVVEELSEPMAFASYLIRLRFDSTRVLPKYAQWMLRHLRVSGRLIDLARTTAGQYNVSLGRLRAATLPVPPPPEQLRIVAELESVQGEVEQMKRLQTQTAAELDALLPAILDRAFKGDL